MRHLYHTFENSFVCNQVSGLLQTGCMNSEYVCHTVTELTQGVSEIYLHPGANSQDIESDIECQALFSPELARERLLDQGIVSGNYTEAEAWRANRGVAEMVAKC